ncbi:MAG: serine/threonine protein kinase, partial [Candidatus Eisenbacteria bacterium]
NILLQAGHAVVADFGIARAIRAAGGTKLTTTGTVLGTPTYMSPEQVIGSSELDGRSDVYSLGCVLYEMLAGVPPFAGATGESLAHQHLSAEPSPVTSKRPAVPEPTARALAKALAKAPADR